MRRVRTLLGAGCIAVVLAACSSGSSSEAAALPAGAALVEVKDMAYKPARIEVAVGQPVAWRFDDGAIPHDVDGDGFKSPTERRGTYTHTFDRPGTYDYICSLHPNMKGTVVVR